MDSLLFISYIQLKNWNDGSTFYYSSLYSAVKCGKKLITMSIALG